MSSIFAVAWTDTSSRSSATIHSFSPRTPSYSRSLRCRPAACLVHHAVKLIWMKYFTSPVNKEEEEEETTIDPNIENICKMRIKISTTSWSNSRAYSESKSNKFMDPSYII